MVAPCLAVVAFLCQTLFVARAQLPEAGIFARTNLVAWCIVPFDAKRRGPEERAAMMAGLGLSRFAYDWRAEHLPTFEAEIAALRRHNIELTAVWFPSVVNDEARTLLASLQRHRLHPQLWVTLGTEPAATPAELEQKIQGAVTALAPVCEAAARAGCIVGLYNHLGWFGEPLNQITVLDRLRATGHRNVGIVYNLHHGHPHLDRFPELFRAMRRHLIAINLNGMVRDGDQTGRKILSLGEGDQELPLLRLLSQSGWRGPVGILGHTDEDAEVKLRKELDGLARLAPLLTEDAPSVSPLLPVVRPPTDVSPPATPTTPAATPTTPAPVAGPVRPLAAPPTPVPSVNRPVNREEPWLQKEGDWMDDRWTQSIPGRWQAYTIPTSAGTVRKGLAIRVGDASHATVLVDTALGQWRAAWTGGFLQFDPVRFGLLNAPRPAGELAFALPESAAWTGGEFRWNGFAVHQDRVVMDYTVDGVSVRESPWALAIDDTTVWIRDIELGPSEKVRTLALIQDAEAKPTSGQAGDTGFLVLAREDNILAAAVPSGGAARVFRPDPATVALKVEPVSQLTRVRVFLVAGPMNAGVKALAKAVRTHREPPVLAAWVAEASSPAAPAIPVRGQLATGTDAYAIDTIPVPYDNPWKALMFVSGIGFFANGDAAVSTIHGDVWRVSGLDTQLDQVSWLRIAHGLYQPLGLVMVDDQPVVLCRDHLVRLHDLNSDRVSDYYESLSSLIHTSSGGHDYATSLAQDESGYFYYVDPQGAHRLSPDGRQLETIARGFRNPNGMGVSPDGRIITVAPQQGEWTPSSVIHEIRADGWYGYPGPQYTPSRPVGYDPPLCWIPHRIDNSSGSQVWAHSPRFGPLAGQLLHLSWGRCTLLLVLRDIVGDTPQGGVVPLKGRFLSGPMRGAISPRDGQLYVVGSQGWQTAAARDGSLQRVRWTGRSLPLPVAWQALTGGLQLTFNEPLDRFTAEDPESYALEAWNYRYGPQYGSKDWSVADPEREGRDTWEITQARLHLDRRTVTLVVPDLRPVMQFGLRFNLDTTDGSLAAGEFYGTIHRLHPEPP
jgi:glucose/arabinose dehydrogenase/sugar phosphate isomerase/epimerase